MERFKGDRKMAVWVIRAGRMGENEEFSLNNGAYSIGFSQEQSVSDFTDYKSLRDHIQRRSEGSSLQQAASQASQLWRFAHDMQVGEMVVLPRRHPRVIAVGRITGDYVYNPTDYEAPLPHTRKVEWRVQEVPRANFDPDLIRSMNGNSTVYQVQSSNAEDRISAIVNAYLGNEQVLDIPAPISNGETSNELDESVAIDLEQDIKIRIIRRIRQRYHGHDLETLVEEILKAEGYATLKTAPGPDGGADILAGSGALGFDSPKLCVQVKSGASPVGIADYNRLQGNVHSFGAEHGLLVSLSGFTKSVLDENWRSFFQIRLWDGYELVERLIDTYDDLPQEVRTAIPLENRLVLMESEE